MDPSSLDRLVSRFVHVGALLYVAVAGAAARGDTDWVLVLDRSQSMTQNDPQNYRFDAQNIMVDLLSQGIGETNRLTIIRFAAQAEVVLTREVVRQDTLDKIRRTISVDPPQGDTDIGAALAIARKTVEPQGRASQVNIIIMSDGVQAGKIPNLKPRLEAEKKAYQELGLPIHAIILNDFSISEDERQRQRSSQKLSYNDQTLHDGEELMRDLSRSTRGNTAQVKPGYGIEDILVDLISPHLSLYREAISGKIRILPTDRQLLLLLNRNTSDARFRMGNEEKVVDLRRQQKVSGDFELTVNPYANRTVVIVRPADNVRWPEWIEVLPGPSQNPVGGDVFVVSNLLLTIVEGLGGDEKRAEEGVKTRVRENEVYPVLFRIAVAPDVSDERKRYVEESLKTSVVRVQALNSEGQVVEQQDVPAAEVYAGGRARPFFLPSYLGAGPAEGRQPMALTLRASIETTAAGQRSLSRAADRLFVVSPSPFQWTVRRNWKGEADNAGSALTDRAVDIELGQEFRLEVAYTGSDAVGGVEILGNFSRAGESAARKLLLRDAGGTPRTFLSDWIFPQEPGEYAATVTVKSDVVQEANYHIVVMRDDFRAVDARYGADGSDSARARDLGSFVKFERIRIGRTRVVNRLTTEAASAFWESEGAKSPKARLLRKDPSGKWVEFQQLPISAEPPKLGSPEFTVAYKGEILGLQPGDFVLLWPERRPLTGDLASEARADVFRVLEPAFTATLVGEDGTPLQSQGGKYLHNAGKPLVLKASPTPTFPERFTGEIVGTLTWARKDVGGPQVVKAEKGSDGTYVASFPTTDFHTGPAKLHIAMTWKTPDRDRLVEMDYDVMSVPKALGVAAEPLVEDVLLGQRQGSIRFRVRPIGGTNPQIQRDLVSLWLSQPVNVTIGESDRIYRVGLKAEGEGLEGALDVPVLPPGTYKLVVSSPVAKLGQDVAACFFNVKPCPFVGRLVQSTSGVDEKILLEPGTSEAKCEGDGAVWVEVGRADDQGGAKLATAELALNGKRVELKWSSTDAGLRSEALPLDLVDRKTAFVASVTDDKGRLFELPLGSLSVDAIPIRYEVAWAKPLPAEMGRGDYYRLRGAVRIRGGLREERTKARESLQTSKDPFLVVTPASILESFQVLPPSAGDSKVFGERVDFEAVLKVAMGNLDVRDSFTLELRQGTAVVEAKRIGLGPAKVRLNVVRPALEGEEGAASATGVPFFSKERLRAVIDDQSGGGQKTYRIQVFAPEAGSGPDAKALAEADAKTLDFSPKKEGTYRVTAEVVGGPDFGWKAEDQIVVVPAIGVEWSRETADKTIKLDSGQNLPLLVRVRGPATLDWEAFQKLFSLKPEVVGEGGQVLAVDFSPWEPEKGASGSGLSMKAFSTKPPSDTASRVRVTLEQRGGGPSAGNVLDVLEMSLVRGGGSLVVVENFENAKGPEGYVLRDLVPGFQVAKGSRVRFGYRTGSSVSDAASLRNSVAVRVQPLAGGPEKPLDVESATKELVVFTPFEARDYGLYRISLEIKGERTQLRQSPEFEVVRGFLDYAVLGVLGAAGLAVLAVLGLLGRKTLGYRKDWSMIQARVRARKDKALTDLDNEPSERLLGEVRLNVGGKILGPVDLNGTPTLGEVTSWVDQHFSMETSLFADGPTNAKRMPLIEKSLAAARTELLAETEKRLPVRGADICVREAVGGANGAKRFDAAVVHDRIGSEHEGLKTLLTLRLLEGGKIRVSTSAGRTVTLGRDDETPYKEWIGKSGGQIRASVKVPGIADYATLTIDLK